MPLYRLKVEAEFSHKQRRPGESVTLDVQAEPNSFIGILAVDKSVKLLRTGNDITYNKVIWI